MPAGANRFDQTPAPLPWFPGTIDPKTLKYAPGGKVRELDKTYQLGDGQSFKDVRQGDYILRRYSNADGTYDYETMGYYKPGSNDLVEFDAQGRAIGGPMQPRTGTGGTSGRNEKPERPDRYRYGIKVSDDKFYQAGDAIAKAAGLPHRNRTGPLKAQQIGASGENFLPTILGTPIGGPGGSSILG